MSARHLGSPCVDHGASSPADYRVLFTSAMHGGPYEFRKCRRCGLIYHFPLMTDEEASVHYTDYGNYSDETVLERELERRLPGSMAVASVLRPYLGQHRSRLLEVGCANGIMMKHLGELGFDCHGVEIDPRSSKIAARLIGEGRIFNGRLEDSPYLDGSFDAAVSRAVLEHLTTPFEVLKCIHRALRNGGVAYLTTPNFGGVSFRLLRDRWKNTAVNDHVSMFTHQSLRHFVEEAGFEIISARATGCSLDKRRDVNGEYTRLSGPVGRRALRYAGAVLSTVNMGDSLHILAQKPPD